MNKSDINAAMLFKFRDRGMAVLLEREMSFGCEMAFYNREYLLSKGTFALISLGDMIDDLTYEGDDDFDILAIKQYEGQNEAITTMLSDVEPEWDWKRKNPKVTQLENIIQKLEQQLEDAKDELLKIKG